MYNLFLVACGMNIPKKWNNKIAKKHNYLNYGLLSLATSFKALGSSPIVVHGGFKTPDEILFQIINIGLKESQYPIYISIISFYSLEWAKKFCKLLKTTFPDTDIVIGGRWVTTGREKWILSEIPEANAVVSGLAEDIAKQLLNDKYSQQKIIINKYSKHINSIFDVNLDYSILYDFERYQPSIEVSRGCGRGCSFCQERSFPLTQLKSANKISEQFEHISNVYGTNELSPYFEASFFNPNIEWAKKLIRVRNLNNEFYNWRCESRADVFDEEITETLVNAGFKVIDLGLESASCVQLLRMKKTKTPQQYLDKASRFIKYASSLGVWIKVNILLFLGETEETVTETIKWLENHKKYIKGVSVGPVIGFGLNHEVKKFVDSFDCPDVSIATPEREITGISMFNLSKEIDYTRSNELSLEISRNFMTKKNYYDLKAFSYFPRGYSYQEFCDDIPGEIDKLPFHN